MKDEAEALRKTLSANIKKHRELMGITQEKLSEAAGISANMINDIEGCRTWISDKTLVKLAAALQVEPHRLLQTTAEKAPIPTDTKDLAKELQKIRKDFNTSFDNALKTRGIKP
jgi:transcriptional regulator with XRE-family HTH domain